MIQVKWGIENEALLKRLRVNAGIDIATLARKTILSTTQVRQLEEGGESAFYSAEIKYSIGKKVLKHLGHELVSDFSTANPSTEINRNEKSANEMTFPLAGHEQVKFEPPLNLKFFGMGRFVLTVFMTGLMFILLWLVTSWPDNLPQEKLATDVSAATHAKPIVTPLLQSADEVVQKVNAEETQKEVATSSQDPCPWQPIELEITPDAPRKKGDFVYLVSVKAVTLCMDIGGQQINTLSLSAGEGRSIYGKGPFKIYSTDLATLQIFFQGQLIKLPSSDIRQVKLSAAPIQ
jgi:transcriptional regulator with XRE-family HTH domain